MRRHKGTSFVELVIAISIIAIIISMSIVRINTDNLAFDSTVIRIKSDIRRIILRGEDDNNSYSINIYKGSYIIYKGNRRFMIRKLEKNIHVLAGESLKFNGINRIGAPGRGGSLYVFNEKSKKLEKITYIPASGRVMSYEDNYYKNKGMIDSWITNLR
nr:hypothetical protein [uncultured Peptostreptococcus sp.]